MMVVFGNDDDVGDDGCTGDNVDVGDDDDHDNDDSRTMRCRMMMDEQQI